MGARISQHRTSIPWRPMARSAQTDTPRIRIAARREPLSSPAVINSGLDTTGVHHLVLLIRHQGLPMQELPLPQLLKPAGYVCGAIGKWHLGYTSNLLPTQRGFDEFFGFLDASSPYYNADLLRDETPLIEPEYLTDAFTREGVSFINRHATQPFFLYLAYNAVHTPYDTPPDVYMQRVGNITDPDRRLYAAMVVALDDGVGQVLQTLQANSILDNTLVFFLSDNGAPRKGCYQRRHIK